MIRHITITNFRSIKKESFSAEEITTFVGNNDAGKSNVLRALNLFFKDQTDHGKNFDFLSDYNIYTPKTNNRAKEIIVELVLKLPKSYRRKGFPDTIYWRKSWRQSGFYKLGEQQCFCELNESGKISKKIAFPPRVKIPMLLSNIYFTYIPAIKDKNFFKDLQGEIHDVVFASSSQQLVTSAESFEKNINEHVEDLIELIDVSLNGSNEIKLPHNLRNIFEVLEFNSGNIPFSRRGDGIKIRHIPSMLKFIGDKHQYNGQKKAIKPCIWAFEEPENNVEFSTCYALNDQFVDAALNNTQIFITTHSPVIYQLHNSVPLDKIKTATYYVSKTNNYTNVIKSDDDSLHVQSGFMQVISPFIEKKRKSWIKEKEERDEIIKNLSKELKRKDVVKNHVFVEGMSDKVVLERILKFYGVKNIIVYCNSKGNNSSNAALDRAIAFSLHQKHSGNNLKAILLLDNDESGKLAAKSFKEKIEILSKKDNCVKVILIAPNDDLKTLKKDGFSTPIDLESLYPNIIWDHAISNGWVSELTDKSKKVTDNKMIMLFNSNESLDDIVNNLSDPLKNRVNYRFTDSGKKHVSNYIKNLSDEDIVKFGIDQAMNPLFNSIISHLDDSFSFEAKSPVTSDLIV